MSDHVLEGMKYPGEQLLEDAVLNNLKKQFQDFRLIKSQRSNLFAITMKNLKYSI